MAYAEIQLFMKKLNQLINCNGNPLIDIPEIMREKPQFQLLHEDFRSIIQTLSIDDLHELEKSKDLKKRIFDAAEEAQYIVDLFLSGVQKRKNNDARRLFKSVADLFLSCVHIRNDGNFLTSTDFERSLNLVDVRKSFESIQEEFMSMRFDNDNAKMDSSRRAERTLNQSAAAAGSKRIVDEMIVGFDEDAKLIRDKLVEDQKKLDVVSIVGMGGIGKTTLATKVFNDGYVKYHFHVRVWVTVSQTFDKRGVLIQILESISGQSDLGAASDSLLRELVHKKLMGKRYLIVIDDIWHVETWNALKVFFPHDNNGSRILLTSRETDVAKHATSDHGLIHKLRYLSKEKGWELLCKKVFHENECPEWSIKPGMKIVEKCQGLPLALALIAGVLAKESLSEEFWVEIAYRSGSYDENGSIMETLGLSYNHLPLHLRECFLYLGGFPEDYMFRLRCLILLWVAEGFIQEDGDRSLEDIAEGYLMDLTDRNLVIVARRSNSNTEVVKAFKLHDLVRELCLRKAKEEGFILQTSSSSHFSTPPLYKPVRTFIYKDSNIIPYRSVRSILCFYTWRSLSDDTAKYLHSFLLLRVLDLQNFILFKFPERMELLVHLRFLAIQTETNDFPSSICNLWGLQTLIYDTNHSPIELPSNISDLVNLRHLWSYNPSRGTELEGFFSLPSIEKPMNLLQTFSKVVFGDGVDIQKCFPYIKKLTCKISSRKENDFKTLACLEKLNLLGCRIEHITLPAILKTLTLKKCFLPWSEMSMIQSLPNLQVLKLNYESFKGSCWNCTDEVFPQLKFLKLYHLDINQWKAADSTTFPCLKRLAIVYCHNLEEIPLGIGEIPTLELIQISTCRPSVGESARRIQEHQQDLYGNYNLKVQVWYDLPL